MMLFKKNIVLFLLLTIFYIAIFLVSPARSGSDNFKTNDPPVEKHYPAVILQKGNVLIDRDFNEKGKDTKEMREELDTDRPGGDFRNFWSSAGPESCREACEKDPRCRSYTFVKPGFQGKKGRCFLKSRVPAPKNNRCCISGVKEYIPSGMTKKFSQLTDQIMKPHYIKNTTPQKIHHVGKNKLEAFEQSVMNKIQELKTTEKILQQERNRHVQEGIRSRSGSKSEGSPKIACSMPQINSVWPTQVRPGSKILIKGCGFLEYPSQAILYDPTGKWLVGARPGDDSLKTNDNNSIPIGIEEWSDTEIHGLIIKPNHLFEPRKVHIKVKRGNQWSNPSSEIYLEPDYDYYTCNTFPYFKPVDIQTNGTTTIVTAGGSCETATIYHLGKGSGIDTLLQNMKLRRFFTFVQIWLTPEVLALTPSGKWESGCFNYSDYLKGDAKIEQDLSGIEGKLFLSKVTVKWYTEEGISYSYAIIVRGPEGWAGVPVPENKDSDEEPNMTSHEAKVITPKKPVDVEATGNGRTIASQSGKAISSEPRFELFEELEEDTDRPGNNYQNFDLPHPELPLCLIGCQNDPRCKAFTYVRPGLQGPKARCWLKDAVPPAKRSQCCISGVKR